MHYKFCFWTVGLPAIRPVTGILFLKLLVYSNKIFSENFGPWNNFSYNFVPPQKILFLSLMYLIMLAEVINLKINVITNAIDDLVYKVCKRDDFFFVDLVQLDFVEGVVSYVH